MTMKALIPFILASFLIPKQSYGLEDLVMDATWEDGTINSGDPDINAEPPLEERLFVDSDIARDVCYSSFQIPHLSKPLNVPSSHLVTGFLMVTVMTGHVVRQM